MPPVTLLVVGAGSRGATYAHYAIEHPEAARVVGVADARAFHRNAAATAHGIPPARTFATWEEAAHLDRFADAVIIATQDHLHEAPALAFAEKGYHVLLEKPIAPTPAACRRIAEAVTRHGILFSVCHTFRYVHSTQRIKQLLAAGAIGELVSVQHFEPVGWWHFAHAFVRGAWRREDESGFFLLTKGCHDFDWMQYLVGAPAAAVATFGGLHHFRPAARPAGAADRCLDCAVEAACPYSAPRLYLGLFDRGETGWPVDVLAPERTREGLMEALRTGPYGRCVYACDNDAADHHVVSLQYENGVTASYVLNAFNKDGGRKTRLFGTHGEIHLDGGQGYLKDGHWHMEGAFLKVFDFVRERLHTEDPFAPLETALSGHDYGDYLLMRGFVEAVATGSEAPILTNAREGLAAHLTTFAAERARREGRVVRVEELAA